MPVVIQQPEPLAPGVSASYGAAEEFDKALPSLVAGQRNIGEAVGQALHARQAGYQSVQQAIQHQGDQYQQWAMLQAHAQIQAQQQQQHAELQNWLGQQQMSQQETMNLQRLQNSLSSVMSDDSLSDEEKQRAAMILRTKIDPLQLRQTQTQSQMQEMQFKQAQTQQKFLADMQNSTAEERAQRLQGMAIPLGDTGLIAAVDPSTGKITVHKDEMRAARMENAQQIAQIRADAVAAATQQRHEAATAALQQRHEAAMAALQARLDNAQQIAQQRADQHLPAGVMDDHQWQASMHQIEAEVHRRSVPPTGEETSARETREQTEREQINAAADARGLGRSYQDYLRSRGVNRSAQGNTPQATGAPPTQPSNQQQFQAAAQEAAGSGGGGADWGQ